MAGYQDLGNASGYLYITQTDGDTIISVFPNTETGAKKLLIDALTAAPEAGEILATGTVTINIGAGTVTTCTVNGVDIMGATAASGATPAIIAADLVSKINSKSSTPEYTATVIGSGANVVQIKAAVGSGTTPNGYAVVAGVTAPTTVSVTDMSGGHDGSGEYDSTFGRRYFINSDSSATDSTVIGSTEITKFIAKRGIESQLYAQSSLISAGILEPIRVGSISVFNVDTQGLAASDDLDTISSGFDFQNNDILIIRGTNAARVVTVKHGVGNIYLANATDYSTGSLYNQIVLQYQTPVGGTIGWYELTRSALQLSVSAMRAQSIATPVQGVNSTAMGVSGTTTYSPGTDKGYQVITGSPVLVGGVVFATGGSPIDGDEFTLDYRATPTIGANTVTIFGITLTDDQTQQKCVVTTKYKTSNTTWYSTLYVNGDAIDFATSTQLATKEDSLPASGGDTFVLQKTIAGAYSFVPNQGNEVLSNTTANNATGANLTKTTLKSYTVAGDTLSADGDVLYGQGVWQTAANANAKTVGIDFGATTLVTTTGNYNAQTITAECWINRTGGVTQSAIGKLTIADTTTGVVASTVITYSTPAETLSADVDIDQFGTNGVASANDIISRQFSVYNYTIRG